VHPWCERIGHACRGYQSIPGRECSGAGEGVWVVHENSRVAAVAGALRAATTAAGVGGAAASGAPATPSSPSSLPVLQAMGAGSISRAVNAVALCNRFLEEDGGSAGMHRLAFVPVVKLWVQHWSTSRAAVEGQAASPSEGHVGEEGEEWRPPPPQDRREGPPAAAPRRATRLHLRLVPREAALLPGEGEDVIRVAAATDALRLSGLIATRWSQLELGISSSPGVFLQAMGPRSIGTLVQALAMSWQKTARSYETDIAEAGFAVLPTQLALPPGAAPGADAKGADVGGGSARLFSGVQFVVVPPPEESQLGR